MNAALLTLLLAPLIAVAGPKLTSADLPEKSPNIRNCDQKLVGAAHASVKRNIGDMLKGIAPSGTQVVAAINRMNSCDPQTGFCVPLLQDKSEFSFTLSESVKDPCVRYCAILHEWEHFIDERPWNMASSDNDLSIFFELIAYEKQEQCLRKFVSAPPGTPVEQKVKGTSAAQAKPTPAASGKAKLNK